MSSARTRKPRPPAKSKAPRPAARAKMTPRRADYGAPIEGFFARQPPHLRAVLERLRALVEKEIPEATSSLKWGMPFYAIDGVTTVALSGHKSHVNLILPGPEGTYADPKRLLEGASKMGRHLKIRSLDELPESAVRGWLKTARQVARAKAAAR